MTWSGQGIATTCEVGCDNLRGVKPSRVFIKWSLIGAIFAGFLLWTQAMDVGGAAGLIQVGEESPVRPMIETELGVIPISPASGHDGQIYYAIGLDLTGQFVPELLDHGGYRYRRILFPMVSSVFGLLDGRALLAGMIVITIASAGVAVGSTATIAAKGGMTELAAFALLANPGFWLSIRLLTADTMAISLMLAGLALLTSRRLSATAFALATLAKDVMLITPAGLAFTKDRRRWVLVLVPVAALIAVMTWTTLVIGDGFTGRGNFALPFMGIFDARSNWPNLSVPDVVYLVFALVSVLAGLVIGILHKNWLRWPILGWSVLGIISSDWVWNFGNNAARVFSPIAVLIVLSLVRHPPDMQSRSLEPE